MVGVEQVLGIVALLHLAEPLEDVGGEY
jgi:hypothetical protein